MLAVMGLCLILTFSRTALLGMAVALTFIGTARYRRLLWLLVLGGLLILILPQSRFYVVRLIEGLRGQDLATRMRFGEYKDALSLIGRYPWFGVGFAAPPDIDLYIGVSSVYLLMAEEMGLVGLMVFLLVMTLFFMRAWDGWQAMEENTVRPILLGLIAALFGAMVGGILDHYFFNLDFPHSVSLFWLYVGLGMAAVRLGGVGDWPNKFGTRLEIGELGCNTLRTGKGRILNSRFLEITDHEPHPLPSLCPLWC